MWECLDKAGTVLFDATLSTVLFLSLVVVAMLVCRQPSRRLLIARVSLLACLAMIPLVALVPLPRIDLLDTLVQADVLPNSLILDLESGIWPKTGVIVPEHESHVLLVNDLHDRLLGASRWLPRSLTLIDLACVSVGIAWLMLGFWGVRWLIRHSRPPSAAAAEIFERLLADVEPSHSGVQLRVNARLRHPVVVGFFRPTIFIPPALDESEADAELLRLSLLHEIAHVEQADAWFGTLASLVQTIWFFVPQTWWLRSQLLIDQEFLADQAASLRYGTSMEYASSLLCLAQDEPAPAPDRVQPKSVAGRPVLSDSEVRSPLSQRVLMLLYCPFRVEPQAPKSWSWALRITLVLATFVAACLCIRWPHAVAREHRQRHDSGTTQTQFLVTDFTAEPLTFSNEGRVVSYVMPVALPADFVLTVEVLSTPADLAKVRIAGHPLGDDTSPHSPHQSRTDSANRIEAWHRVRLVRHGDRVTLWIDGREASVRSSPQDATEWLTFEPSPARATQFRKLTVEW
jgi:beta-lactamase regulating signal transducer with metallopeptidase domain